MALSEEAARFVDASRAYYEAAHRHFHPETLGWQAPLDEAQRVTADVVGGIQRLLMEGNELLSADAKRALARRYARLDPAIAEQAGLPVPAPSEDAVVECPGCGASVPLPAEAAVATCPHCRGSLRAAGSR